MTDTVNIAVVGATSLVGEAFLAKLSEAQLDFGELYILADETGAGEKIAFANKERIVNLASEFDFAQVQQVIFVDNASLTEQLYPKVEAAGCAVIDASGYLGQRQDISLATLDEAQEPASITAIPEAATLQLWLALQPLLQETALEQLHLTVLQCAAHAGKAGVEELGRQTAQLLNFQEVRKSAFDRQLAFNLIPQVGELEADGNTTTENVIVQQLSRLLVMSADAIDITMVWSPIFFGDVITIGVATTDMLENSILTEYWQTHDAFRFASDQVSTPVTDVSGNAAIHVGRLRTSGLGANGMYLSYCSQADPVQLMATASVQVLKNQLTL